MDNLLYEKCFPSRVVPFLGNIDCKRFKAFTMAECKKVFLGIQSCLYGMKLHFGENISLT
jgi:hypothetical protein